jgi:hypothetical protein
VLLKKGVVLALCAVLGMPLSAQQASVGGPSRYAPPSALALLQATPNPEPGQVAPAAGAPAAEAAKPEPPGILKVEVLEGEGARNDIDAGTATAPKVKITDEAGNPVPGAEVVFTTPMGGASAMFHGWVRTQTVRSGEDGVAAATGYMPNEKAGRFGIKVTAAAGNRQGSAMIAQTNAGDRAEGRSSRTKWIVLGVAAAAAGIIAGVVVAGDDEPAGGAANPVTISPGSITVGGPK